MARIKEDEGEKRGEGIDKVINRNRKKRDGAAQMR